MLNQLKAYKHKCFLSYVSAVDAYVTGAFPAPAAGFFTAPAGLPCAGHKNGTSLCGEVPFIIISSCRLVRNQRYGMYPFPCQVR